MNSKNVCNDFFLGVWGIPGWNAECDNLIVLQMFETTSRNRLGEKGADLNNFENKNSLRL